MIPIQDLFETHLNVTDLDRAIAFYRDTLGLRMAYISSSRQVAFFWIGDDGSAMLGLWAAGTGPQRLALHTAFRASLEGVVAAPRALRSAGITPLDFDGQPTDEPVVLAIWEGEVAAGLEQLGIRPAQRMGAVANVVDLQEIVERR
jgi:lactoylglutathione lyase